MRWSSVYGPGRINWDMAVSRPFLSGEPWKLEIRSDFVNIMNHGNGNAYGTSLSSSGTLGTITQFTAPRIIRMAMKLYF